MSPRNTAAMHTARARDSRSKRQRTLQAIDALEAAGAPITASAVAASAGVSTWLVYSDEIKSYLQAARDRQTDQSRTPCTATPPPTPDSITTDLAIARAEIRRLRTEHDTLRRRLQLRLGAEIQGPDHADLIERVATLEETNRRLVAERDARAAEATAAARAVRELEDDLTAARESLRQLIKKHNQ